MLNQIARLTADTQSRCGYFEEWDGGKKPMDLPGDYSPYLSKNG